MGVNELQNWLNWGEAYKTDAIGEYGQGGKAAMGYLGSSWIVQTKKFDESILWEIKEDRWDDVSSAEKRYKAVPTRYEKLQGLGYCAFEIRNLKKHRQDISRIKQEMSNIYRKYLEEGKASISVNYEPVQALKLPLYEGFKAHQFQEKTSLGFATRGWIGRLKRDVRVRGEPRIIGGMRLLRKERLISSGEYFGHHDFRYRASLGTLIGEVDMTKVPVLPNKTGFHTDSPEWEAAQKVMYEVLKPHIEELLSQREEETITREEKKIVQQVRDMMIEAFKLLSKYEDLSSKLAEERGRKHPEVKPEEAKIKKEKESLEEEGPSQRHKEPRTPPPEGAIGRLRRLGRMPEWELRFLEPDIRSDWGEKEGRRCLLINKNYILYRQRDGDELYVAETAALQLARPDADEKLTLEQFLYSASQIMRAFCEVLNSDIG